MTQLRTGVRERAPLDVGRIRADFPILGRAMRNGSPLVYLDSAATTHKPAVVLTAEREYYERHNGAVHRGAHLLSEEASQAYEDARATVADFVGAAPAEIVFTRNTTESLNLVAYAFSNTTDLVRAGSPVDDAARARFLLGPGDEVLVSEMEHHANLLPWQQLCAKTGATLRWFGITDEGRLDLSRMDELLTARTKVVSLTHQSNLLGTVNMPNAIAARAHAVGALFVLDAAQSVPHMPVDVRATGADLVAWSGHKMLGPTGIGALWGRPEVLAAMPPFLTGGSMIETVTMAESTFAAPPTRFEAGSPAVAQAVGLAAAVRYLHNLGMDRVAEHEHELTTAALAALSEVPGLRIIGPPDAVDRGAAISFVVAGVHPHDVGQVLDDSGVEVRVGHHCAWPTCRRFQVPATTRASFYLYNEVAEIGSLVEGIRRAQRLFGADRAV